MDETSSLKDDARWVRSLRFATPPPLGPCPQPEAVHTASRERLKDALHAVVFSPARCQGYPTAKKVHFCQKRCCPPHVFWHACINCRKTSVFFWRGVPLLGVEAACRLGSIALPLIYYLLTLPAQGIELAITVQFLDSHLKNMHHNTSMRNRRPGDRSSPSEESALSQIIFPYGVGIDTHSGFIQVCVIWHTGRKGGEQEVPRYLVPWSRLAAAGPEC
jgi:hypothetical protein